MKGINEEVGYEVDGELLAVMHTWLDGVTHQCAEHKDYANFAKLSGEVLKKPMTPAIKRRCEFLLAVAKDATDERDQTVTFIMRVLSNHATIGYDASSETSNASIVRLRAKPMSTAYDCRLARVQKHDHQRASKALHQSWNWIVANAHTLTAETSGRSLLTIP